MSDRQTIKLFYYKIANFGDLLNELLMERLFMDFVSIEQANFTDAEMTAIGSILDRFITNSMIGDGDRDAQKWAEKNRVIHIWGSGLIAAYENKDHELVRPMAIHALRGELTRRQLCEFTGQDINCVLADPGLLAPLVVAPQPKKWKIGIIPHYVDEDNAVFTKLLNSYPNAVLIHVRDNSESVLKQISQCETILSSSLHGLIVADAYGIPNCWCEASNKIWGAGYKYHDYFSSFGSDREAFQLTEGGSIPDLSQDFVLSYRNYSEVSKKQQELLACFPFNKDRFFSATNPRPSILVPQTEENFQNNKEYKQILVQLLYQEFLYQYQRIKPEYQWQLMAEAREAIQNCISSNPLSVTPQYIEYPLAEVSEMIHNPMGYFRDTCKKYAARPVRENLPAAELVWEGRSQSPKLTIIIPVFNSERYLARCMESVLHQTEKDFEIICVDDGSTDCSLSILLEYARRDHRITVLHQWNQGQSVARNEGLVLARGRYVEFVDSDDSIAEETAEKLIAIADEKELDILYFDGMTCYEPEELRHTMPWYSGAYEWATSMPEPVSGWEYFCFANEEKKYRVSPCMALFRRNYLAEHQFAFIPGIIYEDNAFTFETMMKAERVWHIENQYYMRWVHEQSTTTRHMSFQNVYGYLTVYRLVMETASKLAYKDRLERALSDELERLRILTKDSFEKLEDKESCRAKLTSAELHLLNRVVLEPEKQIMRTIVPDQSIRNSRSYKIGRAITWFPRMVRGGIRCIHEHNLSYTIRRVLFHLKGAKND